jgi:hypothetical protein
MPWFFKGVEADPLMASVELSTEKYYFWDFFVSQAVIVSSRRKVFHDRNP